MNGNKIFIDTNIVLYLLNGNKEIADLLHGKLIYLSFITELELLGYKEIGKKEEKVIKDFLESCIIIDINTEIKTLTLKIRKKYAIKLPDAIVGASAKYLAIPLFSADKGFNKIKELAFVLFEFAKTG